jgi:hypothetical protein
MTTTDAAARLDAALAEARDAIAAARDGDELSNV